MVQQASEGSQSLEPHGFVPEQFNADIEFVTVGVYLLSFDVSKHPGTQDDASCSLILAQTVAGTPIVVFPINLSRFNGAQHVAIEFEYSITWVYSLGFESKHLAMTTGSISSVQLSTISKSPLPIWTMMAMMWLDAFPTDTTESVDGRW